MKKKSLIFISTLLIGLIILFFLLTKEKNKQSVSNEIKIGILKHESSLPLYLADSLGFFKENDLIVKLIELPPGDHLPALVSDRVDIISPTSFPMLLGAIENNPNVFYAIMPGAEILGGETVYGIVTKKDFEGKDIFSLKGKKILAINPYTKVNLLNILKKIGFKKDEIQQINVANRDAALSAVLKNNAVACILDQPSLAVALQSGSFKLLESNPRAKYLGSPYWSGSGAIKQEKWNKNISLYEKFLKAIDKAIKYSREHKRDSQNILADKLKIDTIIAEQMGGYYFPYSNEKVSLPEIQNTVNALINAKLMKKEINLDNLFPNNCYKGNK